MTDPAILFLVICLIETRGYVHQRTSISMFIATLLIIMQIGIHPNVHQQENGEIYWNMVDMVICCPDSHSRSDLQPQLLEMLLADTCLALQNRLGCPAWGSPHPHSMAKTDHFSVRALWGLAEAVRGSTLRSGLLPVPSPASHPFFHRCHSKDTS